MERASRVMYSIANIFTWILAILSAALIVIASLSLAGILPSGDFSQFANVGYIVYYAIVLVVAIITIAMVRRAKAKNSSKGWDVLFIVLGVIGANVFYILGGIFGLLAVRK